MYTGMSEHQPGSMANIVDDYTGKNKKEATINHERKITSP